MSFMYNKILVMLFAVLLVLNGCQTQPEKKLEKAVKAPTDNVVKLALKPMSMKDFYIEPDCEATVRFKVVKGVGGGGLMYQLNDYCGNELEKGTLIWDSKNQVYVGTLKLARGFYDLEIPELSRCYGVVVLPAYKKPLDAFFGMESLLYNRPLQRRDGLQILKRCGIGFVREFDPWHTNEKVKGQINLNIEGFYQDAAREGIKAVYFFGMTPEWSGAVNSKKAVNYQPFPRKLLKIEDSIMGMIERRLPALGAFQVWNEPEMKPFPGDGVMPLVKACSWFMAERNLAIPLVGPGFASWDVSDACLSQYTRNHLLDYIDIFAFHSYKSPEDMIPLIDVYRKMMSKSQKAGMPIWITECGKPWQRSLKHPKAVYGGEIGKLRALQAEDKTSALWITMKAIEAKAGGIAKYFPFTFRFFREGINNFGMVDFDWTPMRSMAAYANCVQQLSHMKYVGDLKLLPSGAKAARVFAGKDDIITVLYTGQPKPVDINLSDLPISRITGIDGRELTFKNDSILTLKDGLAYVHLKSNFPKSVVNKNTPAMILNKIAESYQPVPRKASPVVFQFAHWKVKRKTKNWYYECPDSLEVNVINLSERIVRVMPELILPKSGVVKSVDIPNGQLTLLPSSEKTITWQINLSKCTKPELFITVKDKKGLTSPLILPFFDAEKAKVVTWKGFTKPERWRNNSSGAMEISFDDSENALNVQVDFSKKTKEKGAWAYPEYVLKRPEESMKNVVLVSFDIKAKQNQGTTRFPHHNLMVLYEDLKEKGKGDWLKIPMPKAEWQTVYIAIDPNKAKDIKMLRIGMGSVDPKLQFWLKNFKLYKHKQ